jgi:hypothetical protein
MTFFHVAVGSTGKSVDVLKVQHAFGPAGWARYAPNCWIVKTDSTPQQMADAIRGVVDEMDTIFVCELNLSNNQGFLHPEIWEWIYGQLKDSLYQ